MAQIPLENPRVIYDLGCGPGNITRLLAQRWPGAIVTGVDSSADMLATARQEAPGIAFQQANIAHWSPPTPADVLFSNATLHWLDDHAKLLPRLIALLAPGGVLAVQIPRNQQSPSHTLIDAWRARLARVRAVYGSVLAPNEYYRILATVARRVDIWESDYLHTLEGDNPVVEWMKGTALRPYLEALEEPERGDLRIGGFPRRASGCRPSRRRRRC
jgi:trans-aconitate 2-methyltransferase